MAGSEKKILTNGQTSPKINPDAYWNAIKRIAMEKEYGSLLIEITVHDGQVRGAELISSRQKLGPY